MKVEEVLLLKEAVEDMGNGRNFYESREKGVGDYFWDSLISDFESLYLYAGIHSIEDGLYRMLSKRFPYAIYYSFENEIVRIIAVLPMKRDPLWIRKRLS